MTHSSKRSRSTNMDGVYFLCRLCGHAVGFVDDFGVVVLECDRHGPLRRPSDRELGEAVAKEQATGRPVPLRIWPAA
jgi:hypothetical protein